MDLALGVITLFSLTKIFYHSQFFTLTFKFFYYLMVEIESCIFQLSISTIQNYLISIQGKIYIYIYIYIKKYLFSS